MAQSYITAITRNTNGFTDNCRLPCHCDIGSTLFTKSLHIHLDILDKPLKKNFKSFLFLKSLRNYVTNLRVAVLSYR